MRSTATVPRSGGTVGWSRAMQRDSSLSSRPGRRGRRDVAEVADPLKGITAQVPGGQHVEGGGRLVRGGEPAGVGDQQIVVEPLGLLAGQPELEQLPRLLFLDHEQVAVAEQQQPLAEGVLVGVPGLLLARVVLHSQVQDVEEPLQSRVEHEHRARDLAEHEHRPVSSVSTPSHCRATAQAHPGRGEQWLQVVAGKGGGTAGSRSPTSKVVAVVPMAAAAGAARPRRPVRRSRHLPSWRSNTSLTLSSVIAPPRAARVPSGPRRQPVVRSLARTEGVVFGRFERRSGRST